MDTASKQIKAAVPRSRPPKGDNLPAARLKTLSSHVSFQFEPRLLGLVLRYCDCDDHDGPGAGRKVASTRKEIVQRIS